MGLSLPSPLSVSLSLFPGEFWVGSERKTTMEGDQESRCVFTYSRGCVPRRVRSPRQREEFALHGTSRPIYLACAIVNVQRMSNHRRMYRTPRATDRIAPHAYACLPRGLTTRVHTTRVSRGLSPRSVRMQEVKTRFSLPPFFLDTTGASRCWCGSTANDRSWRTLGRILRDHAH